MQMRMEEVIGRLGADLISDLTRDLHDRAVHKETIAIAGVTRREAH